MKIIIFSRKVLKTINITQIISDFRAESVMVEGLYHTLSALKLFLNAFGFIYYLVVIWLQLNNTFWYYIDSIY